jgi:hypothetical protein
MHESGIPGQGLPREASRYEIEHTVADTLAQPRLACFLLRRFDRAGLYRCRESSGRCPCARHHARSRRDRNRAIKPAKPEQIGFLEPMHTVNIRIPGYAPMNVAKNDAQDCHEAGAKIYHVIADM